MWYLRSACAASIAAAVSGGAYQRSDAAPTAPPPTIRLEVRQVLVPVVVYDKRGHNVTGLKADDFRVFEDGIPQRILAFSSETDVSGLQLLSSGDTAANFPSPAAPLQTDSRQGTRRTYLICLDTLNSSFEDFSRVRSSLQRLFKQEQGSEALYAVAALGRQVLILQNLTRDPASVLAVLASKKLDRAIRQSEASNLIEQQAELSRALADYCRRCACAGSRSASSITSGGSDEICDGKRQQLQTWAGAGANERSLLTRTFLRQLGQLVGSLADQPGKRSLIFISDGFNLRPGRDLFGLLAAYFQDPGEVIRNPGDDLRPELMEIVHLATTHDIAFYSLDSRGLYGASGAAYDASVEYEMTRSTVLSPQIQQLQYSMALEDQDAMAELASDTGGLFFRNGNDLLKGLRQALADGREYYMLSYVPTNRTSDGKFRAIKVDVSGRGLVARAKRGYWAPKMDEAHAKQSARENQ